MATNNRPLKAYVRYDGSGRAVSSSLIWRKNKPKVGKWKEIQGYECCNVDQTPVVVGIESSFPINYASVEVGPENGNWYQRIDSYTDQTANDIYELATLFNSSFPNLGSFRVVDDILYWTPSIQIAEFYKANNTTALYAYAFND
jgi:hypothetical protein